MYRWHESAGGEAEDHPRAKVVTSESVTELEILCKHVAEAERDGLPEQSASGLRMVGVFSG